MRTIISLVIVLLPCLALAAGNCRIVEYPDHNEAICDGSAERPAESSQHDWQEPQLAPVQTHEAETPDVPPEMIVRNELARSHMSSWLKSNQVNESR